MSWRATKEIWTRSTDSATTNSPSTMQESLVMSPLVVMDQVSPSVAFHGSLFVIGKTLLMEASIVRDAQNFAADTESDTFYCQIICVWQKGAQALNEQYRALEKTLPRGPNLETMVLTKEEIMKKFMVKDEGVETTNQINTICKNITQLFPGKEVHLYIDECWITVPRKYEAHLTPVNLGIIK